MIYLTSIYYIFKEKERESRQKKYNEIQINDIIWEYSFIDGELSHRKYYKVIDKIINCVYVAELVTYEMNVKEDNDNEYIEHYKYNINSIGKKKTIFFKSLDSYHIDNNAEYERVVKKKYIYKIL